MKTAKFKIAIRLAKYAVNVAGLIWMLFGGYFSYAIIVRFPDCNRVIEIILFNLKWLMALYLVFVIVITSINYFVERKLEKRILSKEFIGLLIIHVVVLLIGAFIFSFDFYSHCGEPR